MALFFIVLLLTAQVRGSVILDVRPLNGSFYSNVTDLASRDHENDSSFGSLWGDDVNFTLPKVQPVPPFECGARGTHSRQRFLR